MYATVTIGGQETTVPTHTSDNFITTFRNPITIHENKHRIGFGTGAPAMEEISPNVANSFTVNCESTFNKQLNFNQTGESSAVCLWIMTT